MPLTLTKLQRDAAQDALDRLDALTTRAVNREPLDDDDLRILRACADHAGRAAAAHLLLKFEGEDHVPHDTNDWVEMLTYVVDPF